MTVLLLALVAGCSSGEPTAAPSGRPSTDVSASPAPPDSPPPGPPPAPRPDAVHGGYFFRAYEPGHAPRVPLVTHRTLLDLKGDRTRLPALPHGTHYLTAVRSGDGLILCRTATDQEMDGSGYAVITRLDALGTETGRWLGVPLRLDPVAGVAMWRDGRDGVRVADLATGRERLVRVAAGAPFALLSRNLVVTSPRGRVSLVGPDGRPVTTGPVLRRIDRLRALNQVTGLAFGERRRARRGERTAAYDIASGLLRWTSDRWHVMEVSPDGRYVAAISSATGGDADAVGILDAATGAQVAELPLLADGIGQAGMVFEPDGSLLVQVYRQTSRGLTWTVLRLRTDQRVLRVARVFATDGYVLPYAFGAVVTS